MNGQQHFRRALREPIHAVKPGVSARPEGPPLLGLLLLYLSIYLVWGGVTWWVNDIIVGSVVALFYAFAATVYVEHWW